MRSAGALLVAAALLSPCAAGAALPPGCPYIAVTPLAFGTYDPFAPAPDDAVGTITYDCNSTSRISITPTIPTRTLWSGADPLPFQIYTDAARTQVWGDGANGTTVLTEPKTPGKSRNTVQMYGRIPAQQDAAAGTYTATLVVTFDF